MRICKGVIFKSLLAMTLMVLCTFIMLGCKEEITERSNKLQVATTIYPLQDFATKIGGSYVEVRNLVPPGVDPHDYELTFRDMKRLDRTDILVYNGAGFEGWLEKMKPSLKEKGIILVNSTTGLTKETSHSRHEHDHKHTEEQMSHDPHIWLNPLLAKEQAKHIRDAFITADVQHRDIYEENYQSLAKQFEKLDSEFLQMVKKSKKREIMVSHAAFGYLAERYGLKQIAISGISPMHEPSPKELQYLIAQVKKYNIHFILFETLVDSRVAKVIQQEVDAKSLTLNPLEGLTREEAKRKADYFSVMRKNKENLRVALGAAS